MTGKITLAIESGIEGGSVSLFQGKTLLDSMNGEEKVSRSEEILQFVETLLKKNGFGKTDIARAAVSNGPGSLTGLRIGLSIARGLTSGLSVPCEEIPLLSAMVSDSRANDGTIVAVSIDKTNVYFQEFANRRETIGVQHASAENFIEYARKGLPENILINAKLRETFGEQLAQIAGKTLYIADKNLSVYIGTTDARNQESDNEF